LVRALRENGERDIRLIGTDMSELAIGRHLCDAFYVVPPGADPSFAVALTEICKNEQVDAVLPQSSFELHALAENRGSFGETTVLRSEEHTSELQSPYDLVCRLLLEKKKKKK